MFARFQFTKSATLLSALTAMALVAPGIAAAEERPVFVLGAPAEVRIERVSFARLDLTNARDQKRLYHRVGAAVERVCLREIGRQGLQDSGYYTCAASSWDRAAPQIAAAKHRALEIAMTGRSTIVATAIAVSA